MQIVGGHIEIDGNLLSDDPVDRPMVSSGIANNPTQLGDDEFFVLGDNRDISLDSRNEQIGIIKKSQIKGIVKYKIWRW